MHTITDQQVIAGLIAAPDAYAQATMSRLEPRDFGDWRYHTIYAEGLRKCTFPDHREPGSIIVQINALLLNAGHYQATDNGLRQSVIDLAQITGHPEQLPALVAELIERRFRREVIDYAAGLTKYAEHGPLADVDAALRQITKLRRLRARIDQVTPLKAVQAVREGGAA